MIATNLQQNDPDMLTALLDRYATAAAGYAMNRVFPPSNAPSYYSRLIQPQVA